jgi:hypothetical protein
MFALLAAAHLSLIAALEDVAGAPEVRYSAKDERGVGLDCLKPFQTADGRILGVHHAQQNGRFLLELVRSQNALDWTHVVTLDDHAHQPTAHVNPDGSILLAYEKDGPNGNWIRLRAYPNVRDLENARHTEQIDLERTFSKFAEGTPSIERVQWRGRLRQSTVDLRLHYYREGVVDRAARGTLDRGSWHPKIEGWLTDRADAMGVRGNLGDRDALNWDGTRWHLQEVQMGHEDWASWRIFLVSFGTRRMIPLHLRTHGGSTSFANPAASWIRVGGQNKLVVTLFLPSQGNPSTESGQLIYLPRLTRP